jgi:hypothetical protein
MADQYLDPSGNTEQFQAFAQNPEPAPAKKSNRSMLIGGAVVAVVVVALLVWLALS